MNIWVKEGHEGKIGNYLRWMEGVRVNDVFPADRDGYVRINLSTALCGWEVEETLIEEFPSIPFTLNFSTNRNI
jgi:hypothetical protein